MHSWLSSLQSRTKELYLSRAVDVQPCFNREVISDLSDQATTNLLDLGAWAEGENIQYGSTQSAEHTVTGQSLGTDENDTDSQILQAANTGNLPTLKEWISRLRDSSDARDRFTRTFLAAVTDASEVALDVLLQTELVDIHAKDEINERNCLHEAAISGREFVLQTGLSKGVESARVDVYGRTPLHYACMHGHVKMVRELLEINPTTVDSLDHDNFTPLIHGIVHHQFSCVQELLHHRARIDPQGESDHVPLNLACQHGSVLIAELLLQKEARILPDAEGLYPQHLVARSGQTPQLLLMLASYGADLDQKDKLYQWTPLFHAASEGCVQCLNTLLQRGVDVSILDEKGLSAMYYATWEGHLECMKLLGSVGGTPGLERARLSAQCGAFTTPASSAPVLRRVDADGIPDLSLPPPIIPLRRYGHNFLDDKTFVQISFEEVGSDAIIFYHDSKYPAARLTISSKLSDLIPRNIMLPIQEDFKMISFQIDNLESFAIDFDIFPTFGSKVIAKSVALPNIFSALTSSSGHCCLPLFDPRLRAIGQISFNFQVIKPFHGIPLEITHFATYWKATSQLDSHPTALITGSSLSGEYAQLFVQLTSDGMPVLYPQWTINHHGIEFPIGRLTYKQFVALGLQRGNGDEVLASLPDKTWENKARIHELLTSALVSLRAVLACLPTSINLDLNVMYPTAAEERALGLGPTLNINNFADAILKEVFDHARISREKNPDFTRSIVFTSYNPDICVALNWKQPNCKEPSHTDRHHISTDPFPDPVLLCNDLGSGRAIPVSTQSGVVQSSGRRSMSVKVAVRIAQSNNFMGLICSSRLLVSHIFFLLSNPLPVLPSPSDLRTTGSFPDVTIYRTRSPPSSNPSKLPVSCSSPILPTPSLLRPFIRQPTIIPNPRKTRVQCRHHTACPTALMVS